jgi:hypothetical protein
LKHALLAVLLLAAAPVWARKPQKAKARPKVVAQVDPARFFASQPGLIRIYEGRTPSESPDEPPAGASCEVLESRPRDPVTNGSLKENCTMIAGRKARAPTRLTYELRKDGIFNTQIEIDGKPQALELLVLPSPIKVGASWKEPRGAVELDRTVRSAGGSCKAAGRTFADCLVLDVVQKQGKSVVRRYSEIYAAGVGLVESAQWELVDVKGL